jgi:hypothetical protein
MTETFTQTPTMTETPEAFTSTTTGTPTLETTETITPTGTVTPTVTETVVPVIAFNLQAIEYDDYHKGVTNFKVVNYSNVGINVKNIKVVYYLYSPGKTAADYMYTGGKNPVAFYADGTQVGPLSERNVIGRFYDVAENDCGQSSGVDRKANVRLEITFEPYGTQSALDLPVIPANGGYLMPADLYVAAPHIIIGTWAYKDGSAIDTTSYYSSTLNQPMHNYPSQPYMVPVEFQFISLYYSNGGTWEHVCEVTDQQLTPDPETGKLPCGIGACGSMPTMTQTVVDSPTETLTYAIPTGTFTSTPSFTATASQTYTPTSAVFLQYYTENSNAYDNTMQMNIKIVNGGPVILPLQGIKIKYWFKNEGALPNVSDLDWSSVSGSPGTIVRSFQTVALGGQDQALV